jgi:hypothetical protein
MIGVQIGVPKIGVRIAVAVPGHNKGWASTHVIRRPEYLHDIRVMDAAQEVDFVFELLNKPSSLPTGLIYVNYGYLLSTVKVKLATHKTAQKFDGDLHTVCSGRSWINILNLAHLALDPTFRAVFASYLLPNLSIENI